MQNESHPQYRWWGFFFAGIILLVVIVDQLSKLWIVTSLYPGEILRDFGVFQIIHVRNTGAAFGIFKGYTTVLIVVDFIALFVILYLVIVMHRRWPFIRHLLVLASLAMLTGGLLGNMIDRIRAGYVTDFIDFKFWPVWNIADASTVVGTIILTFCLVFLEGRLRIKE